MLVMLLGLSAQAADVAVQPFESCAELEEHLRGERREHRHRQLGQLVGVEPMYGHDGESGGASVTLVQEPGVDEADRIRVVGSTLFAAHEGGVSVVDVSRRELLSEVVLGKVSGIMSDEEVLVAVTEGGEAVVIDVSEPRKPVVERRVAVEGKLQAARRMGDTLVLVTATTPRLRPRATDWTPRIREWRREVARAPSVSCADVARTPMVDGVLRKTTVVTVDLVDHDELPRALSLMGPSDVVYASEEAVWVAQVGRGHGRGDADWSDTVVHRVAIGDAPRWSVSAVLPGHLHGRMGLSERDGVLRTALTDPTDWTTGVSTWSVDDMGSLGTTPPLAPGERTTGARFDGDTAYVVTFQVQTGDPLFVVDLSDPAEPHVRSELHVPGWSDQLHASRGAPIQLSGGTWDGEARKRPGKR